MELSEFFDVTNSADHVGYLYEKAEGAAQEIVADLHEKEGLGYGTIYDLAVMAKDTELREDPPVEMYIILWDKVADLAGTLIGE